MAGQHRISIEASLETSENKLNNSQEVVYTNTSKDILTEIYFNDWANSFATKTTPLARRFGENYDSSFHFEKDEDRGRTTIFGIQMRRDKPWIGSAEKRSISLRYNWINPLPLANLIP